MKCIGNKDESAEYRKRPGAYVIITKDNDSKVGIVAKGEQYFYLGGGIEEGETQLDGLKRELVEEAGYSIKNVKEFEDIDSYIFSENRGYLEIIANVYTAEFDERVAEPIEKDHNVIWVEPEEYAGKMYREWQRYIMQRFIEKRGV